MPTKTRVANKTQWALDDILKRVRLGREAYKAMLDRNHRKLMDPLIAIELSVLIDALTDIDRITRLALQGDYEQEIQHD